MVITISEYCSLTPVFIWVGSEDFKLAHRNPIPPEAFNGEGKLEMLRWLAPLSPHKLTTG